MCFFVFASETIALNLKKPENTQIVPESNVKNNEIVKKSNIENNEIVPESNVENNEIVKKSNVENNEIVKKSNVENTQIVPESNVENNKIVKKSNVKKEKILKKTNSNFNLNCGLECKIKIEGGENKLDIYNSEKIFFNIPNVNGGITFYPFYDLKSKILDINYIPKSAYINLKQKAFGTENYLTFLYNQIGVYDSNWPEIFQFNDSLLKYGDTLSCFYKFLNENYSTKNNKYDAFCVSGQRELSYFKNAFSNLAASCISEKNKIETWIFSIFFGKNLSIFNINFALNSNFWLSGNKSFNELKESFNKTKSEKSAYINQSIEGGEKAIKNFDLKVFDFAIGFFNRNFFSFYLECCVLYFPAEITKVEIRNINDIKIKGSLILSEFIREMLQETFWGDLLKKISFGVYGEMSCYLTKFLFFLKIFILKIEFEKNKNQKWDTSFTIDYKNLFNF